MFGIIESEQLDPFVWVSVISDSVRDRTAREDYAHSEMDGHPERQAARGNTVCQQAGGGDEASRAQSR